LHGRNHVLPEDVQAVLPAVVTHRLTPQAGQGDAAPSEMAADLIRQVPIP
jgi:MoxR-like ATPase